MKNTNSPICLMTGATSGIGRAAATELARAGYHLVLVARNESKAIKVKDEIQHDVQSSSIDYITGDLSSLQSIDRIISTFKTNFKKINLLINNAGILTNNYENSIDGYEIMMATNHLSHFKLTLGLLDSMQPDARIINTSSRAHVRANISEDDPLGCKSMKSGMKTYSNSKLANILFTRELVSKLPRGMTCFSFHPGIVNTNIFSNSGIVLNTISKIFSNFLYSPSEGAKTLLKLALEKNINHPSGCYFNQNGINVAPTLPNNHKKLQKRLWAESLKACNFNE